jgi:hypothetical protein
MNLLHSGEYHFAVTMFSVSALCFQSRYGLFYTCCMCDYELGSSVSIMTRLCAGRPENHGLILGGMKMFFLCNATCLLSPIQCIPGTVSPSL